MLNGAELLVQSLKNEGVEHIFGYPGGAVLHIYDALNSQDDVKHILVRHEQGATHAADGYARSTGKPGVVLVTLGAGFLPAAIAPLVGSFLAPVALGLVAGAALIFAKDKILEPLLPKFKEKIWNPLKSLFKNDKPTDDVVINDQTNDKNINLEAVNVTKDLDTNKILSGANIVQSNLDTISTPTDLKDIGLLDGSDQISKLSNLIPDAVNTVNESLQNVAENLLDSQQKTPIIDTPSIK